MPRLLEFDSKSPYLSFLGFISRKPDREFSTLVSAPRFPGRNINRSLRPEMTLAIIWFSLSILLIRKLRASITWKQGASPWRCYKILICQWSNSRQDLGHQVLSHPLLKQQDGHSLAKRTQHILFFQKHLQFCKQMVCVQCIHFFFPFEKFFLSSQL